MATVTAISTKGGGGGRYSGTDCCDLGCQDNCRMDCTPHGQIPPNYHSCWTSCIEAHGGACDGGGGNGNGGGGGINPPRTPCPAQSCPSGQYWSYISCRCLPRNNGGGTGSGDINYGYQYCNNCMWSECSFCNPNDMLQGHGTKKCGGAATCGTKITTKQECDETTGFWDWVWDGTEPCENQIPKPTVAPDDPVQHSPLGCFIGYKEWLCGKR